LITKGLLLVLVAKISFKLCTPQLTGMSSGAAVKFLCTSDAKVCSTKFKQCPALASRKGTKMSSLTDVEITLPLPDMQIVSIVVIIVVVCCCCCTRIKAQAEALGNPPEVAIAFDEHRNEDRRH
jgi:hypothetical protein